ncbi:hypothetical protein [Streptomyces lavendulocolor]|uniref:hypothetical protein n=1 Tax=Streptomyces lavendulocolor TaxID=67316 RepID=UPI003C2CA628
MKKALLACLAAAVTVSVAAGGYLALRPAGTSAAPVTAVAAASYDPAGAREAAAQADDVFHGTVLRGTGRRTIAEIPSRLYEVRVGHVFKGGIGGTVTVTQPVAEPALRPGGYVFATTSWHNGDDEHGLLAGSPPHPADDLTAPVRGAAAGAGTSVGAYWREAVGPRRGGPAG